MRTDIVLALAAIIAFSFLWGMGVGDGTQDNYCEMRKIYEESGGQWGWPAHDEDKEEGCSYDAQ